MVSRVTGILKGREIHNFVFRNNLLMITCHGENRLFMLGFGVQIMNQLRLLIRSSVERSSEVKSAPIKTLDDFEDLEKESCKFYSSPKE